MALAVLSLFQGTVSEPIRAETTSLDEPTIEIPIGPASYDGDGESCRMDLIQKWLEESEETTWYADMAVVPKAERSGELQVGFDRQSLLDMKASTLYRNIREDCRFFLDAYNTAVGDVCVYEQISFPEFLYSKLWTIGPINMDAEWLLAVDLLLSNRMQDARPLVPCADSCYVRYLGNDGTDADCQQPGSSTGEAFLKVKALTSISRGRFHNLQYYQEPLCHGWLQADAAYQTVRVCAAESVVTRTMISDKDQNGRTFDPNNAGFVQLVEAAKAVTQQWKNQTSCMVEAVEGFCRQFQPCDNEWDCTKGPADSIPIFQSDDDYAGTMESSEAAFNPPSSTVQRIAEMATVAILWYIL